MMGTKGLFSKAMKGGMTWRVRLGYAGLGKLLFYRALKGTTGWMNAWQEWSKSWMILPLRLYDKLPKGTECVVFAFYSIVLLLSV